MQCGPDRLRRLFRRRCDGASTLWRRGQTRRLAIIGRSLRLLLRRVSRRRRGTAGLIGPGAEQGDSQRQHQHTCGPGGGRYQPRRPLPSPELPFPCRPGVRSTTARERSPQAASFATAAGPRRRNVPPRPDSLEGVAGRRFVGLAVNQRLHQFFRRLEAVAGILGEQCARPASPAPAAPAG